MPESAPLVKGASVVIHYPNAGWFDGKAGTVSKIEYKPYPSGKKTPGWWATVKIGWQNGLRGEIVLHSKHLEKL